MPVHRTDTVTDGFTPSPPRTPAPPAGDRGFRAALLSEESKAAEKPAAAKVAEKKPVAPKGEKTEAVENHRYAEITAGPRNGMFLNTSGNVRDGQAFTLVERSGFHFHIYGTGRDRQIFRVPDKDDAPAKPATPATPAPGAGGVKPTV